MVNREDKNFKRTEAKLYKYFKLKADIDNLELTNEILELESLKSFDTVKGINYSRERVFSSICIDSEVESLVIDHEDIKDRMIRNKKLISIKKRQLCMIENALNSLNDIDRKIVELRYFKKETWYGVSKKIGYSVSSCKKRRVEIIKNLEELI